MGQTNAFSLTLSCFSSWANRIVVRVHILIIRKLSLVLPTVLVEVMKVVVVLVLQADRDRDSGVYTIRLTCEAGTFEASGRVNVLDVPLKPRNLRPGLLMKIPKYLKAK